MQEKHLNIKRLAVIPARGGSKRIDKKNIKKFHGKPIINYSLEALELSNLFDVIHVSTDSVEIENHVSKSGEYLHFRRSKNLSDDHSGLMSVLKYVQSKFSEKGQYFDEIWLVSACAPLLNYNDYIKVAKSFSENENFPALTLVTELPTSAYWALTLSEDQDLRPIFEGHLEKRSQDLPKTFVDTGLLAIFSGEFLKECTEAVPIEAFQGYEVPRSRGIDIDTIEDWGMALAMYKHSNK